MTTWLTSDTHYSHVNILLPSYTRRRETFADLQAMNEGLVGRWNERVKPEDSAYHLGDLCMGDKSQIPNIVRRLNGHKHLVLGNHDYKKPGKVRPEILECVRTGSLEGIYTDKVIELDGKRLLLVHEPCQVPEGFDYVLCGHVHESFSRAHWDAEKLNTETGKPGVAVADPNGNILNVGVDVCDYYPMTLEELLARPFYQGPGHRI